jgi:hypothetical protein
LALLPPLIWVLLGAAAQGAPLRAGHGAAALPGMMMYSWLRVLMRPPTLIMMRLGM